MRYTFHFGFILWCSPLSCTCKQQRAKRSSFESHPGVTRASGKEQSDLVGKSLEKRRQESEPALISVFFSFLLRLSEVKYHWSKSGKGEKTQSIMFDEERLNPHGVGNLLHDKKQVIHI